MRIPAAAHVPRVRWIPALLAPVLLIASLVPLSSPEALDPTPEQRAQIIRLMELTGSKSLGTQMEGQIVSTLSAALKQSSPELPERAFEILAVVTRETLDTEYDRFLDRVVPVYARHFEPAEIDALVAFYSTPTGRKAIAVMPTLGQEVGELGVAWAQDLLPRILAAARERLDAEGIAQEGA